MKQHSNFWPSARSASARSLRRRLVDAAIPAPIGRPGNDVPVQIELLSRPAVKELFEKFVDHQTTNAVEPYNDPTLQGEIQSFTDALRPPECARRHRLRQSARRRALSQRRSRSTSRKPAARRTSATRPAARPRDAQHLRRTRITDDVIDISLGAVFGKTLSRSGSQPEDNEENNCLSADNVAQNADAGADGHVPLPARPPLRTNAEIRTFRTRRGDDRAVRDRRRGGLAALRERQHERRARRGAADDGAGHARLPNRDKLVAFWEKRRTNITAAT
jgi:hypothetical protein